MRESRADLRHRYRRLRLHLQPCAHSLPAALQCRALAPAANQCEAERAALARFALDRDLPAVSLDNHLADRQPKPGAPDCAIGVGPVELLEHLFPLLRGEADSLIRDTDLQHRADLAARQRDHSTVGRVLYG